MPASSHHSMSLHRFDPPPSSVPNQQTSIHISQLGTRDPTPEEQTSAVLQRAENSAHATLPPPSDHADGIPYSIEFPTITRTYTHLEAHYVEEPLSIQNAKESTIYDVSKEIQVWADINLKKAKEQNDRDAKDIGEVPEGDVNLLELSGPAEKEDNESEGGNLDTVTTIDNEDNQSHQISKTVCSETKNTDKNETAEQLLEMKLYKSKPKINTKMRHSDVLDEKENFADDDTDSQNYFLTRNSSNEYRIITLPKRPKVDVLIQPKNRADKPMTMLNTNTGVTKIGQKDALVGFKRKIRDPRVSH